MRRRYCRDSPASARLASRISGMALHDMRRTCAKLCRAAGGDLEQIQLLLGHASMGRYLGTRQSLVDAPNDYIGLETGAE